MPPKIIANLRHIVAVSGETVELPCSTQAHPWPTFTWYRTSSDIIVGSLATGQTNSNSGTKRLNRLPVATFRINTDAMGNDGVNIDTDQSAEYFATPYRISKAGRLVQVDSSLFIRDITPQDSGTYVCVANNSVGQDRFEIELLVRGKCSKTHFFCYSNTLKHATNTRDFFFILV